MLDVMLDVKKVLSKMLADLSQINGRISQLSSPLITTRTANVSGSVKASGNAWLGVTPPTVSNYTCIGATRVDMGNQGNVAVVTFNEWGVRLRNFTASAQSVSGTLTLLYIKNTIK